MVHFACDADNLPTEKKDIFTHEKIANLSYLFSFFRVRNPLEWVGLVLAVAGAFLTFPCYYETAVLPLDAKDDFWSSLEPSWMLAINYANINDLVWGIDAVFSYGPLGNLCTRIGWGESKLFFLLFDVFMAANYFAVFYLSFRSAKNKLATGLLIALTIVMLPYWVGSANALILMFFLVFWVRRSLENPRLVYYIFQIAIVCLLFYIKFNTGLIVFVLYYAGLVYNAKHIKLAWLIFYAVAPIVFISILSVPLNVALVPYIKAGFELVSGFNDTMYLENPFPKSNYYLYALIGLLVALLAMNIAIWKRQPMFRNVIVVLLFSTSFFILYKQSFVRADLSHLNDFFIYLPLLILCNFDLHAVRQKWLLPVFALAMVLPPYFLYVEQKLTPHIGIRFSKFDYIAHLTDFTPDSGMPFLVETPSKLPQNVLSEIGVNTVDIFPWNIQLLVENKLNYLPRPVFQSYSAYTPYLADLNFEHYNNPETAPSYVLYDFGSIDNRYPLFDEPKTNLILSKNYNVVQTFIFKSRTMLLLKKKPDFKPIVLRKVRTFQLAENRLVPKSGMYYELKITTNPIGKIASIADHSPATSLEIGSQNTQVFKTSSQLLATGIFSSGIVQDTDGFRKFIENPAALDRVKYFQIIPDSPSLFNEEIEVTEYRISQ